MQLKQCAVCGTQKQSSINHKWQRDLDGKVFHICNKCRREELVNEDSVNCIESSGHKTFWTKDEYDWKKYCSVRGIRTNTKRAAELRSKFNLPEVK